jgi:hypothetical protein
MVRGSGDLLEALYGSAVIGETIGPNNGVERIMTKELTE